MAYTPKFQEILDKVSKMQDEGFPLEEIQDFFKESVKNLGPYERLNNLYRIRPKRPIPGQKSRMQFFCMNKMQKTFFQNHTGRDLVLKMRQGGVTTLSCLVALDKALWEEGTNSAIMAHVRDNVKKFFKITKSAFDWFRRDWGELYPVSSSVDNVNELHIAETGSSLTVCTETKGLTLDFLHISEACFVEDSRISESIESVPLSGWVVMESTPNTASGMFYDLWEEWRKGQSKSFTGHFFEWWYQYPEEEDMERLIPDGTVHYTDKESNLKKLHNLNQEHILWRRLKISEAGGDEDEFMRKYPEDAMTCFLSGSRSVFSAAIINSLLRNEREPSFYGRLVLHGKQIEFQLENPGKKEDFHGLRIWEKPKQTHSYAIGADVSEGINQDASCAQVVDCTTGLLVANYHSSSVDADNYAAELYKLALFYNNAYICPEVNNQGHVVISHLSGQLGGLAYNRIYKREGFDEFLRKKTKVLGFKTTVQTKWRLIENLKSALRDGDFLIYDRQTILELNNFIRDEKSGKMGAQGSAQDDRVMALALACEQYKIIKDRLDKEDNDVDTGTSYAPRYDPMTGFPI